MNYRLQFQGKDREAISRTQQDSRQARRVVRSNLGCCQHRVTGIGIWIPEWELALKQDVGLDPIHSIECDNKVA